MDTPQSTPSTPSVPAPGPAVMPGAKIPVPKVAPPTHVPHALAWGVLIIVALAAIGAVLYVSFAPTPYETAVMTEQPVTPQPPQAQAPNPIQDAQTNPVDTVKLNPFE